MNYEIKYDKGKPLYANVPKELLDAVSTVMEYGKNKYGISTWHVVEPERYVNAMLRHIYAMQTIDVEGKQTIDLSKVDSESGIKHLYHIACNIAFIIAITERSLRMEDKKFVLDEFMEKGASELTDLYLSIHKMCIKHKLDLVIKLLDYLEGMYSKPIILVKLYNLYKYDRWEDTDDDFIYETFKIVKEEHYTDIHKFGSLVPRGYNKYAYYHEFIDEVAGSVFSSTYFDVVKCDVVIAAFRQVAKFIFEYPLSEFNEEEK